MGADDATSAGCAGMRKKHIIGIVLGVVFLGYIPFSPVFITSVYGTQPKTSFQGSSGDYAYLWVVRRDSFQPFLFFGFWRFGFIGKAHLMFRSEKGNLKAISIADASIEIGGKTHGLPQVSGQEVQMDFSTGNMYGGSGSSGVVDFNLPEIPEDSVNLYFKGVAVRSDGESDAFDMTVRSQVEKDESTIMLFQYIIAKFTET